MSCEIKSAAALMAEAIAQREKQEVIPFAEREIIILGERVNAQAFANGDPTIGLGNRFLIPQRDYHCSQAVWVTGPKSPKNRRQP